MPISLSILIPSIPERMTHLARTVCELERQAKNKPVEILVLLDNKKRTTGSKRSSLIQQAQGEFISFVDDDDRIATDYVDELLHVINKNPQADCINFLVEVDIAGLSRKKTKYHSSLTYSEDENFYYRKPNHIMCYARRIASQYKFPDTSYGEDDRWAHQVCHLIRSEEVIDKVLYYYDYKLKRPNNNPVLRNWENHMMVNSLKPDLKR
ncbi:glycosyltransferase family A protein [Bacillus carboniphilus]|uniref:Glycosyltransferase family A protein n=1 Tax=Bacillus carboniphilus TaxID=86663 RepID=A0ABY9K052_9BACI|nr:glycosyltransferase family A protein [Bacillus carboniphilus]WLR44055.1 glycosyltransferase family A protein [Bacillus carboniphilus]